MPPSTSWGFFKNERNKKIYEKVISMSLFYYPMGHPIDYFTVTYKLSSMKMTT